MLVVSGAVVEKEKCGRFVVGYGKTADEIGGKLTAFVTEKVA